MEKIKRFQKIKISSEKNFGIVFGIISFLIFNYFYFLKKEVFIFLIFLSAFFLFFSYFYSKIFYYPNKLWHLLGIFLGHIVSQIIMGVIFFLVITPTRFYKSFFNEDFFNKNIIKEKKSYWTIRDKNINSMKDQY